MNISQREALIGAARTHRTYSRRSAAPYTTRLKNVEHYLALPNEDGWVIEPLAWCLLIARGGDHQNATRGDSITAATKTKMAEAGFRQVAVHSPEFEPLWEALTEWCLQRKTTPSARKTGSVRDDRSFWLPVDDATPEA